MTEAPTQYINTDITSEDLSEVAFLLTCGVKLKRNALKIEKESGKTQCLFLLESATDDGTHTTDELRKAWKNPEYIRENPDCHISFMKMFHHNRGRLLDEAKAGKGYIQTKENGMTALVNPGADPSKLKTLFA